MFKRQCTSSVWTASYLRSHFAFDLSYGHRVASSVLLYCWLHAAVIAVITCNTRVSTKAANDLYQHASSARKRNSGNWGGDNLAIACDSKSAISISQTIRLMTHRLGQGPSLCCSRWPVSVTQDVGTVITGPDLRTR